MSNSARLPNISTYQPLFRFDGFVPFVISWDFVNGYLELGGVALSTDDAWRSYMFPHTTQRTMQDGLELYKDKRKYEEYKEHLYQTFKTAEEITTSITTKTLLTRADIDEFFSITRDYRRLYMKTEFFYTDLAYEKRKEFPQIEKNFATFEEVKLDGRTYLNTMFFVPDSLCSRVLRRVSNQFQVPYEDLLTYSFHDLARLFMGQLLDHPTISERKGGYVIYAEDGAIYSISGEVVMPIIKRTLAPQTASRVLRGRTANKGKVTARAKVIKVSLSEYENISSIIDSMEQGQVLVAETTEPSIIVACNKASAIITNQGGMMSHAAIVAREMNIPCIIGVPNATEMIQDGDLVEVDANHGIIKILNRKTAQSL